MGQEESFTQAEDHQTRQKGSEEKRSYPKREKAARKTGTCQYEVNEKGKREQEKERRNRD